jgi:hypothetical protein
MYASQLEYIKIKVVPVHVVKAYGGRGRAPFMLNLFASWRRVVRFMAQLLSREESISGLGLRAGLDALEKKKYLLQLPAELKFRNGPSADLLTTPTVFSQS